MYKMDSLSFFIIHQNVESLETQNGGQYPGYEWVNNKNTNDHSMIS